MSQVRDGLNLTAMIDMMTILLIFLLVQYASMSFSDTEANTANLPKVSAAGDISSDVFVMLGKEGITDKDGKNIDLETLKGKKSVSLQVEKTVKMKEVLDVQAKLQNLGISHIELAVIETK